MSMEVISVNIWLILISLCNLLILFLILKKFLFKPVTKTLDERKKAIDADYAAAAEANSEAEQSKSEWNEKLLTAKDEASKIITDAAETAKRRSDDIIGAANSRADSIIKQAESEAILEKKKASSEIKKEIVDVSAELSEKVLGREINADDHKNLIDSFIDGIGDDNGTDK